jgi:glycosyltransferase involved in cell wall biosynthesis
MKVLTSSNILFITHDVSRSGAPFVLLCLLRWLKKHQPNFIIDVVALNSGALEDEFRDVCDNFMVKTLFEKNTRQKKFIRLARKVGFFKKTDSNLFIKALNIDKYTLVYANSVVALPFAIKVLNVKPSLKIISHLHELETVINLMSNEFLILSKSVSRFIVPSQIVKDYVCDIIGIKSDHVYTIHECTELKDIQKIKDQHKRKKNNFKIGACGFVDWRKGYDIFILVALHLVKKRGYTNFNFFWVGKLSREMQIIIGADLKKLGLNEVVKFQGEVHNPWDELGDIDLFLLPSREDPFPLAAIEAGMLGKPIICFDSGTGISEVLNEIGGSVVPYLDVEEMARSIISYYESPKMLKVMAERHVRLFSDMVPEIICPKIFDKILEEISNSENE